MLVSCSRPRHEEQKKIMQCFVKTLHYFRRRKQAMYKYSFSHPLITFAMIVDEVPLALFSLGNLSFSESLSQSRNKSALVGVLCVVIRAERRTAQTQQLANQSLGCTAESRISDSIAPRRAGRAAT